MATKPLEQRLMRMLQLLEKHPELYKQCDPIYHKTVRVEKQKTWDRIAKISGFVKTDHAKCRWRALLVSFRQVLEDVARKKVRRYIPNTGNPLDKYVQLSDWRYYEYMRFMEPYIKIAVSLPDPRINNINSTPTMTQSITKTTTNEKTIENPSSVKANVDNSTVGIQVDNKTKKSTALSIANLQIPLELATVHNNTPVAPPLPTAAVTQVDSRTRKGTVSVESVQLPQHLAPTYNTPNHMKRTTPNIRTVTPMRRNVTTPVTRVVPPMSRTQEPIIMIGPTTRFDDLVPQDKNLKSFFDAMLRSTQRLPKYHQERVKCKLLNAIRSYNL